jgi:hypothetical protein
MLSKIVASAVIIARKVTGAFCITDLIGVNEQAAGLFFILRPGPVGLIFWQRRDDF